MIPRLSRLALLIVMTLGASACGDGAITGVGDVTGSDPVSSQVTSITALASSAEIPSNASGVANGVRVFAIARDARNNVVSGATVIFQATSGLLQVVTSTTDAAGIAEAILTTGGNPATRSITVTVSAGSVSDTEVVNVVGNQLTINAPAGAGLNAAESIVVTLRDAAGSGVSGQSVTLSSALGSSIQGAAGSATLTTNGSGQATFNYIATTAGTDTLSAVSAGNTAQAVVTVGGTLLTLAFSPANDSEFNFEETATVIATLTQDGNPVSGATIELSSSRGILSVVSDTTNGLGQIEFEIESDGSDGAGPFTITASASGITAALAGEFVATTPALVALQAEPSKIGLSSSSTIRAVVRDAAGNLVKNQRVNFTLNDPTGGSISPTTGLTNSQGAVSVTYTSRTTSSATDGVVVTGRIQGTMIFAQTRLTVGGTALRISLGTGNEMFEESPTTYRLPYSVIVTDAAGNPAPSSTVFRIQVRPIEYQKGRYAGDPLEINYAVDALSDTAAGDTGFGCRNEDVNGNGSLDAADTDDNMNGRLDPDAALTVPASVPLDSNGVGNFGITYTQDLGNWLKVELTVTATVDGTESRQSRRFVLPILASDAENPPGNPSPFGLAMTCADPN